MRASQHLHVLRRGFWQVTLIAAGLASVGALPGCSPYAFSKESHSLHDQMRLIDTSYQDNAKQILVEQRLINRTQWIRDKPQLVLGPGCRVGTPSPVSCDLAVNAAAPATDSRAPSAAEDPPPTLPTAHSDVCDATVSSSASATSSTSTTPAAGHLPPSQPTDLLSALDNYTAALEAITKAADRADFNNAAAKLSDAVASLTQSAAAASGVAAGASPAIGAITSVSVNVGLWLVGQGLDYQRWKALRMATGAACEPVHVLASALGVVLEDQRGARLDGLHTLLLLRIQAVNIARRTPHMANAQYGDAIDNAQAAADAFQAVSVTDPEATAQALSAAHDALVAAVRNNDGQLEALVASLQMLAEMANGQAAAADTASSPASAP